MTDDRIVITGIGVVAPNGIGKDAFWESCANGVSGIKPITLFDTADFKCHHAGEVTEFDPKETLGKKGLRNLDRTTLLSLVAAEFAIEDAALEINDANRHDIGVVLGSTMGSVHSISEFDRTALREGPRYVNPAHFPNTVINSPASQVAIRYGLKSLNSTISNGFTTGIDAIGYAMDMLHFKRAKVLLVGGVEELCIETFLGFYKLRYLLRKYDFPLPTELPFNDRFSGTFLGEGSVFFTLEHLEDAVARGAHIYAEIKGYGSTFHRDGLYRLDREAKATVSAMQEALEWSGLQPQEITHFSSCANSTRMVDEMEDVAIDTVFGAHAQNMNFTYTKALVGEAFSAGSVFQLADAVGAGVKAKVPVASHTGPMDAPETWMINSTGVTGASSALCLGSR